jgi:hypothetical protein
MLDIYFGERGAKPTLQLSNMAFRSHWDAIQTFSSRVGVEFSLYRDFSLVPDQCKIFAEILEAEDLRGEELGEPILRFLILLWKAVAKNKNLYFVGD